MNELNVIERGYDDFEMMCQEEGMKKVLWSVWNQLSMTKENSLFARKKVEDFEKKY